MKEDESVSLLQSLDMQQRMARLQKPVDLIRQELITYAHFGYKVNLGLLDAWPQPPEVIFNDLIALGGQEFACQYLPFLCLLNGFDINGVHLYGFHDEGEDSQDIRRILDYLPFPEIYDGYVLMGSTDLDVLIFDKSNHHFEIRDRIGFDYIVGSYPQLDQFLQVLATSIKKSFEDEDEDDRE